MQIFERENEKKCNLFAYFRKKQYLCSANEFALVETDGMPTIVLAIIVLAVAMLLLCVGVIFRKDHSFRSQHIGENERMRKDGIRCATSQDRMERIYKQKKEKKNNHYIIKTIQH